MDSVTVVSRQTVKLTPTIKKAAADWNERRLVSDRNGDYRQPRGPVAPYNDELRAVFPSVQDFALVALATRGQP